MIKSWLQVSFSLTIVTACLYQVKLCTTFPTARSLTIQLPLPSRIAVSANAVGTVVAFPKSRDGLDESDEEIRAIIRTGEVTPLIREHSTEFKGIVCWYIEAETDEIDSLKSKVPGVDVVPNDPVIRPADVKDGITNFLEMPSNDSLSSIQLNFEGRSRHLQI
ncbi:hypothetical protein ACLMJK_006344 [Lecanora helva]